MPTEKDYTSTLARMAGNIAGTLLTELLKDRETGLKTLTDQDVDFIGHVAALQAQSTLKHVLQLRDAELHEESGTAK